MTVYTLDEIIEITNGGSWTEAEYSDSEKDIYVVKVTNMVNGSIAETSNDSYLPESLFNKYKNHQLKFGDVCIATVGSHPSQQGSVVGRTIKVQDIYSGSFLNQNAAILRPKDGNILSNNFFYYLTKTIFFKHHVESRARGSANQVRMAIGELKKFSFNYPDIQTQKKVAAVLSAYDDLIEKNKKRIQILENMAEELYKEWFVRFRFPNWENTEFEKGVPKGWEIEKVSNLVDRKKFGRVYKEFELASEGSVPVIDQSQKNILGFHEGEAEHKASFESPMIIFGDHSCKMQMMFENFSLAENVIPLKSKGNISLLYLFSLIKDQVETTEYKRHWGELTSKKVLLAPISLQEKYASLIIDKMKLIETLKTANNYLVSCRDQLLPRLISGKLSVEHLDIQFPPSMQEQ